MKQNFWWLEEENSVHNSLFPYVEMLRKKQSKRIAENLSFLRLYGNRNYSISDRGIEVTDNLYSRKGERSKINIVQSVCDTITSKISKNKPRPMFLTQGHNQELAKRAELLGDFVEGMFLRMDIYTKMPDVFLDSTIFDIGVLKIFEEDGDIKCEKVFPMEIFVDEQEGRFGKATHLYQVRDISRYILEQEYGDIPVSEESVNLGGSNDTNDDNITCIEAWHLPSSSTANDGRHIISIEGRCLFDEPWLFDDFPFIFLRWNKTNLSWYGQSLTEQLFGIQVEINQTLHRIAQSIHLLAVPFVMIEAGSNVSPSHIRNVEGTIINYTGRPPQIYTPNVVPSEVFAHLDRMKRDAYEISGISQLSATSTKPKGISAGVALRTLQDVETERFMTTAQNYENAFMKAAEWIIRLVKKSDDEGDSLTVLGMQKKSLRKLKWKEVSLDENEYLMRVFPVSLLPSTPTGRLQMIQELVQAGLITSREQTIKLLNVPDLDSFQTLATVNEDYIDQAVSDILDGKQPPEPYPQMDLALAQDKFTRAILNARINGVSEERLEILRTWLNQVLFLQDRAKEQVIEKQIELQRKAQAQQAQAQQAQAQLVQGQQVQQPEGQPQGQGPINPQQQQEV